MQYIREEVPKQTQEEENMASVSLQHIYKVYSGNVTAVSDFTLDIEDKEFIVLVGPSGCGKSTTLPPWCSRTTPCIPI